MKTSQSEQDNQPALLRKGPVFTVFPVIAALFLIVIAVSAVFLIQYHPAPSAPAPQMTLEQKMAHLDAGTPLPQPQNARPAIPRWMLMIIFGFVLLQILPLLLASYKARAKEFTPRELRQIEFLAETPLFLGLLGSLLGVCMTQFISGSLAAPLAYLTTISGILLYLLGRFTFLVSLPPVHEVL